VAGSDPGAPASFVTIGLRSVPLRLFLPPLPLAADAATLAICLPLFSIALVRSTPSMVVGGWWLDGWGKLSEAGQIRSASCEAVDGREAGLGWAELS
jgi:hypothetical protein